MSTTNNRFVARHGLDANSLTLVNVADPVQDQDAVTKKYLADNFQPKVSGIITQTLVGSIPAATGNNVIPFDNSTPTNTEGIQLWSRAITPSSTSSKVLIQFTATIDATQNNRVVIMALFRGSTCIATVVSIASTSKPQDMALIFMDSPASIAAQTYSLRVGIDNSSGAFYVNSLNAAHTFGNTLLSNYRIEEIL